MFSKKTHADIKKSTQKLQDPRKDSATRFKHLKIILDHVDNDEAKGLFETNFHHIFFVFYESFITAETNLRQKELPFHLGKNLQGTPNKVVRILDHCDSFA
uniref:Putative Rho GTPase-activating protein CG5521 n=1 Tax=Lygus hesperus TaxID=30085 RepID=A0A0A9X1L9_LYGHE